MKFMLIVKLVYGFRLNLYLGFDIYEVDFDLARPNQKDAQIRRKRVKNMVIYTASIHDNTEPTFSSKKQ